MKNGAKNSILLLLLISCCYSLLAQDVLRVEKTAKAEWWGGIVNDGHLMPFAGTFAADLDGNNYWNQTQPLMLSNRGDVVWSEDAFSIQVNENHILLESKRGEIEHHQSGTTLRSAFQFASKNYFPPSGEMPDEWLFSKPQYNTWIELMYDQNQKDILAYAQAILDNGMPPGVLMIDDNWQENYGKWDFHPGRFTAPKKMMAQLHQQGFKVMMWICPFISADSDVYRDLAEKGVLLKNKNGLPAMIRWWNGVSALLDFTNPKAVAWFKAQLDFLQKEYGVDGFKFDAGDASFYTNVVAMEDISPNQHTQRFAQIGLDYPLNEYRVNWKMGGQALANRLADKSHNWPDLQKLIPNMIMEGLMGYTFACPDMIGGGEFKSFLSAKTIDQELIVRSAQCHALMPMMQFSVAPWRILDQEHLSSVLNSVKLRMQFSDYILAESKKSAASGWPILRSMEFAFPDQGYAKLTDQFLIGETLLVAPVLAKGETRKTIVLPKGQWKGFDGKMYNGPQQIELEVNLDSLPYFVKETEK